MRALGTRPALARQRVSGAIKTRLASCKSPMLSGSRSRNGSVMSTLNVHQTARHTHFKAHKSQTRMFKSNPKSESRIQHIRLTSEMIAAKAPEPQANKRSTGASQTLDWSSAHARRASWDWKSGPAKGRVEAGCCQPAPLSEPYLKVSLHTAQAAPTGAPCAGTRRQPSDVRNDFGLPGEGRGRWGVRTSAEHAPCKASALREVFGVA